MAAARAATAAWLAETAETAAQPPRTEPSQSPMGLRVAQEVPGEVAMVVKAGLVAQGARSRWGRGALRVRVEAAEPPRPVTVALVVPAASARGRLSQPAAEAALAAFRVTLLAATAGMADQHRALASTQLLRPDPAVTGEMHLTGQAVEAVTGATPPLTVMLSPQF